MPATHTDGRVSAMLAGMLSLASAMQAAVDRILAEAARLQAAPSPKEPVHGASPPPVSHVAPSAPRTGSGHQIPDVYSERWTPERLALLRSFHLAPGVSLSEAARRLCKLPGPPIAIGTLDYKVNRLGIVLDKQRAFGAAAAPVTAKPPLALPAPTWVELDDDAPLVTEQDVRAVIKREATRHHVAAARSMAPSLPVARGPKHAPDVQRVTFGAARRWGEDAGVPLNGQMLDDLRRINNQRLAMDMPIFAIVRDDAHA